MGNDEKGDLLLEVTENEEDVPDKDEIDYSIDEKILEYIQNEKPNKNSIQDTIMLLGGSFCVFLFSSLLIITLPIYFKNTSAKKLSTYSKLVTLSSVIAVNCLISKSALVLLKCLGIALPDYRISLGKLLKVSLLLSIGNILVFVLADGNYLSCHLRDPLRGSSIVFALLFYYLLSRKKMSLERMFCAITIIPGVFISTDFGICDKYQCDGNSNLTETTQKFHFLYVIVYILAHGIWILHLAYTEVFWTTQGCGCNLNVLVFSKVSTNMNSRTETLKPETQSLSVVYQDDEEEQLTAKKETAPKSKSLNEIFLNSKSLGDEKGSDNSLNSAPQRNQYLSLPDLNRFPLTSTPNNERSGWKGSWASCQLHDLWIWQNLICFVVVLGFCWLATLSVFNEGKEKLLVDVLNEAFESVLRHFRWSSDSKNSDLKNLTLTLTVSYTLLSLSIKEVMDVTRSAVTVVSVMMAALPTASLFWSLFRLNEGASDFLEFRPEISGEAICAILGLPLIGIGIVLLMKSHIREFYLIE